jgi:hypothetical protein
MHYLVRKVGYVRHRGQKVDLQIRMSIQRFDLKVRISVGKSLLRQSSFLTLIIQQNQQQITETSLLRGIFVRMIHRQNTK